MWCASVNIGAGKSWSHQIGETGSGIDCLVCAISARQRSVSFYLVSPIYLDAKTAGINPLIKSWGSVPELSGNKIATRKSILRPSGSERGPDTNKFTLFFKSVPEMARARAVSSRTVDFYLCIQKYTRRYTILSRSHNKESCLHEGPQHFSVYVSLSCSLHLALSFDFPDKLARSKHGIRVPFQLTFYHVGSLLL